MIYYYAIHFLEVPAELTLNALNAMLMYHFAIYGEAHLGQGLTIPWKRFDSHQNINVSHGSREMLNSGLQPAAIP